MWLSLTVCAVISRAVYGVLTKVLSNRTGVGPITQTTWLMLAATIWALALSPFIGGINLAHVPHAWLMLTIAIVSSALGNLLYFKGIAKLEAGTTQIAFSSILIWSLIMATVFLGTRLTSIQFAGVLVLLLAILLAQYQKRAVAIRPGIGLVIASAGCFAAFQISSAVLSRSLTPGTYLVLTYLGDAILIGVPYLMLIRRELTSPKVNLSKLTVVAFITGAASILYNVFAYVAYRASPDSGLVVLLLTSQVVLAVLLSMIFLHERSNIGRKLAAGVLALVAAIMIKI